MIQKRRRVGQGGKTTDHPATMLDALGVPPSAEKAVRYFVTHPTARPYARKLQLRRVGDGRLVRYVAQPNSRFWRGIRLLIADPNRPADLLRDSLCDVEGVKAAFVFGSSAKGTARSDSDIDVFVVQEVGADPKPLHRQLAEAAVLLSREINPTRYTIEKLAGRLGDSALPGSRFIREVLSGPKQWVAGTPEALAPVALAAGISIDRVKGG
jgi:predicted nucleotidyltransferase